MPPARLRVACMAVLTSAAMQHWSMASVLAGMLDFFQRSRFCLRRCTVLSVRRLRLLLYITSLARLCVSRLWSASLCVRFSLARSAPYGRKDVDCRLHACPQRSSSRGNVLCVSCSLRPCMERPHVQAWGAKCIQKCPTASTSVVPAVLVREAWFIRCL